MPAHRERSSSVNYGGPALVTNGDYLTIRANPLENNLAQWPDFSRSAGLFERLGAGGPSDVFYLCAARAARGFGDGFAAIILPAYLLEVGFNPFQIGIVAPAALLGSAATTLAIGYLAPRYDARTLLLICAVLMIVTDIAIPNAQQEAPR